ncbi:regulatory protein, MarR [Alkaliphilus metalliredigens QYMF]|uniref:Regulatory protein, MarR n=2 Tax=Alkaliphilus TaxID=114627 RepID=A6TJR3_ALKMQ|nr:regulatory protein, MarR [Alkaliphilus metalliredigens QYMF]
MDKEYMVLEEIKENQHISQRQLAHSTGLSLGSVNILLKKMVKEGLIKVESIPANRVAYMVTPKGIVEKANKTYNYIRQHYKVIEETKKKVKELLLQLMEECKTVYIQLQEDEISQLVRVAVEELGVSEKVLLVGKEEQDIQPGAILITVNLTNDEFDETRYEKVINLVEWL